MFHKCQKAFFAPTASFVLTTRANCVRVGLPVVILLMAAICTEAEPTCNKQSGFFQLLNTNVVVTASNKTDMLHYTLDGSQPSPTVGVHIEAGSTANTTFTLPVSTTTVLRVTQGNTTDIEDVLTITLIDPFDTFTGSYQTSPDDADCDVDSDITDSYFEINDSALAEAAGNPNAIEFADFLAVQNALAAAPTISIVLDDDLIWGANGILSWNSVGGGTAFADPDAKYDASFEWIEPDPQAMYDPATTKRVQKYMQLKQHGGSSIGYHKQSFSVKFDGSTGGDLDLSDEGITTWNLFNEGANDKFDELIIRNPGSDSFMQPEFLLRILSGGHAPSYARNPFAIETMRDMGNRHPRSRLTHVYLNGLYWGIYWVTEMPNRKYMENETNVDKDEWVAQNEGTEPNNPTAAESWFDDKRWLGAQIQDNYDLAWNGSTVVAGVSDMVDLDHYADFMIVSSIMFTGDGFPGRQYRSTGRLPSNYSVFNSSFSPAAKIQFYSWDQDYSMNVDSPDLDFSDLFEDPAFADRDATAILVNMKNDPDFKDDFAAALNMHCRGDGALTITNALARFDDIADELDDVIVAEHMRWGKTGLTVGGATVSHLDLYDDELFALEDYIEDRLYYMFHDFVTYLDLKDVHDMDGDNNDTEPLPNPYPTP